MITTAAATNEVVAAVVFILPGVCKIRLIYRPVPIDVP